MPEHIQSIVEKQTVRFAVDRDTIKTVSLVVERQAQIQEGLAAKRNGMERE